MDKQTDRWFIAGSVFCSLFVRWIYEPESRSITNALLMIAVVVGVMGLYESAKAVARAIRRKQS
jgi:hypothetical protein